MATTDFQTILWAIAILASPLVMALPLRALWGFRIGNDIEHEEYRAVVRDVMIRGQTLRANRVGLDALAKRLNIDVNRQGRIENDVLRRLKIPHFILLPVLVLSPLVGILGALVMLLLQPLIMLMEWIFIDRRVLVLIVRKIQELMGWTIIGIRRPEEGMIDTDRMVRHMHRLPTTAFFGLFSFLIVAYMPMPEWLVILIATLVFITLTSILTIVQAAVAGELVFADASQRRMTPLEKILDDIIAPVVGVGLLFLLSRQLFLTVTASGDALNLFKEPILFSVVVLVILYTAAAVGIMVEWGFFVRRGERVRTLFLEQVIESEEPQMYAFTRDGDQMSLERLCSLRAYKDGEHIDDARIDFEALLRAPSAARAGGLSPPTRPEITQE